MSDPIQVDAHVIEPEKKSRHYKWWFVALGVVIALMGVACLAWPAATLVVVATLAAVCFLGSGITRIATFFDLGGFALMGASSLVMGVLDVLLGIMFFAHPLIGGATIALVAGVAFIVTGVLDVFAGVRAGKVFGTGTGVLEVLGALVTVVFGVLMVMVPSLFIVYLGVMLIIRGVMVVVGAFTVSSFVKDIKQHLDLP